MTLVAEPAADLAGRAPALHDRWVRVRQLVRRGAGPLLVVAGMVGHLPPLVLIGLVAAVFVVLRRWLPTDLAVPAAVLAVLSGAVAAGVVAGLAGVDLLARPAATAAALLLVSAVSVGSWSTTNDDLGSAFRRGSRLATAPALVAFATGLLQMLSTGVAKSWAFWGTDVAHHMTIVRQLQETGRLDYAAGAYPKGLHMLGALVSVPGAPVHDPQRLMDYDLRLVTALTWFGLALLLWTGGALAVRIATALRLRSPVGVAAALVLGAGALLTNTFLETFVYMGGAQSLLAVVVLWVIPLALLAKVPLMSRLSAVATASVLAVMLLAHLWQALTIVPVVALAAYGVGDLPGLRLSARSRAGWSAGLRALPVVVPAAALALVPVLTLQSQGGTAAAATPGDIPPGPWHLLALAAASLVPLALLARRAWSRHLVGSALGLLVAVALLLRGAGHGFDVNQYYPLKTLWFLLLLLAPVVALWSAWLAAAVARAASRALSRTGSAAFVLRAGTTAVLAALAFALWLPWMLGTGSGTTGAWHRSTAADAVEVDGLAGSWSAQRYDIARRYGTAYSPDRVVPFFVGNQRGVDPYGTRIVSGLLTFLTGQPEIAGDVPDLCGTVHLVAGDQPAVVLSKRQDGEVAAALAKGGCSAQVRVVHLDLAQRAGGVATGG
jgi:hypothetical protein